MVVERLVYGDKIKILSNKFSFANIFRWLVTFMFVNFAWIPFRVNSIAEVKDIFTKIFSSIGYPFMDQNTLSMAFIAFVLVFANDFAEEKSWNIRLLRSKNRIIRYLSVILLICYILAFGVLNGGSFIYFQF